MSKVPSLPYDRIIGAWCWEGWVVVRQKGSHIRLQKQTIAGVLKTTVPAHRPILRSTLAHILKQARPTVDELNQLPLKWLKAFSFSTFSRAVMALI